MTREGTIAAAATPPPTRFPAILGGIAVALLLATLVADELWSDGLRTGVVPLAFLDGARTVTVTLLGTLFLVLRNILTFPPSYRSLGSALLVLGLFEASRAIGLVGGVMLWLSGVGAVVAGALVVASWLNLGDRWRAVERLFPWLPIAAAVLLGLVGSTAAGPDVRALAAAAGTLVSVGAFLFLFAALLAAIAVSEIARADSLFLAASCLGLSLSFVTVPFAPEWHPLWWWGETFRLAVYLVGVCYVLLKDRRLHEVVVQRSAELEREVDSRRDAEQTAHEGRERLSAVFAALDAAEYGILVEDGSGRLFQANRSALRLLGMSEPDELIGRRWAELGTAADGPVRGEPARLLAAVRAGRDAAAGSDGEPRVFAAREAPLADGRGTVIVFTDVTDEARARAERARLERDLQRMQKMEALGALAGGLAHEINNLLQPILTYAELAETRVEDERTRTYLVQIQSCVIRAREIVRGALAFARLDAKHVDRRDIVAACAEGARLGRELVPRSVRLDVDLPAGPLFASIAETELIQILLNLLKNAAEATGDGGAIALSGGIEEVGDAAAAGLGVEPGRYFVVTVRDDGPGFTDAVRERLFEPFFTTKPPGQGTGLGLSVAYGIVGGFGGTIVADSPPGGGAELRVYVPLLQDG